MSPSKTLRIPPVDVFAVREDQDGGQHEFIDQAFKFSSAHLAPESVCLRLSHTVIDGDSNDTAIYLQITPDHLDSLRFKFCKSNDGSPPQPHLDNVRRRLGGKGDLTRLRFQLRSGVHAQLIVPKDFPDYEALDSPARRTLDLVASLAASSSFSLYLPANTLSKQLLNTCVKAVPHFSTLTGKELLSYRRAVDLQRLYRGKGGKVLGAGDYHDNSRANGPCNRPTSPAKTESYATTVDFDTVPRHQGSPPQYDESVIEGAKPRAISDDAASFSPSVDCAPPEYSETEQPRNTSVTSKRARQGGHEDVILHPSTKRVLSQIAYTTISTTALPRNGRLLEAKPRSELDGADIDGNMLLRNLMHRVEQHEQQMMQLRREQQKEQQRQEHQIKQLQDEVEKLRKQNTELEGRHRKVEDICDHLEHRQDLAKDDLENLDVHIGELEELCDKLEKQMPNISDELEDLVRDKMSDMWKEYMGDSMMEHLGDLLREHMCDLISEYMDKGGKGNLAWPLREYVRRNVKTQMAKMKAKLREALQG